MGPEGNTVLSAIFGMSGNLLLLSVVISEFKKKRKEKGYIRQETTKTTDKMPKGRGEKKPKGKVVDMNIKIAFLDKSTFTLCVGKPPKFSTLSSQVASNYIVEGEVKKYIDIELQILKVLQEKIRIQRVYSQMHFFFFLPLLLQELCAPHQGKERKKDGNR